ncbi:MAG: uracil-DNA glycosylase family protein [Paracoccaceae bacterium]
MRPTDADLDSGTIAALLSWQAELGADEPIGDSPVNRYLLPATSPWAIREAAPALPSPRAARAPAISPATVAVTPSADPAADAQALAAAAMTLRDLAAAQAAYDHCDLKRGARNFVFADGLPGARVMVLGEAPGADEDREGRPFVGRAGQLLDRMFAAIGLARSSPDPATALYISNILPWRPPQNREPTPDEMAMMLPFVRRHIALAAPEVLVLMGNTPCLALLGQKGILKLRGQWTESGGRPVLPMTHPAYLLRNPAAKREAWADLLSLKARLDGSGR